MKKFLLLLLVVMMSLPMFARDFEYTYEGQTLRYTILDEEAKTCSVSENSDISGVLIIPSIAKDGDIEYTVTVIVELAFRGCYNLTSVTIPNSITRIDSWAFSETGLIELFFNAENCSSGSFPPSLQNVTFGDNVKIIPSYAFSCCSSLTTLTIPDSVTTIGESAFDDCTGLTSVNIGNSVTTIGSYAFLCCSSLTSLTIGNSVTTIGKWAFFGCSKLTELFFNAENCTIYFPSYDSDRQFIPSLEKVFFGDNVKTIPASAFQGCSGLTSVTIPNTVTTIGDRAFSGCVGLTEMNLGNSVTTIGRSAFFGCVGLTEMNLGNSVTTIGDSAFSDCSGLTSVTIPNSVNTIDSGAFYGCVGLVELNIGNSVTTIGSSAFKGCSALTSVTIPNSVTTIDYNAFSGCDGLVEVFFNAENCTLCGGNTTSYLAFPPTLQKVIFGDNVKIIPKNSFRGCSMTTLTIPNSVTYIGDGAFYGCIGLAELFFNAENCSYCGRNSFWETRAFPSSLQKVTFGDKVKNIPENTFYDCFSLTEANIPSIESWLNINFESKESNPTYYAKKLLVNGETIRRLTIPEGTKRINAYSFINCEPLVTVTLPSSLESIGSEAFSGCTGLQRDIFPDAETYLGINYDSAYAKLTYDNKSKIYIGSEEYNPEEIDWPSILTKIPDYAFYGNQTLKSIKIPETVTEIGNSAFLDCSNLTSINIPNSVITIGDYTFKDCSSLTSVTIPNSITKIGHSTFRGCYSLSSVTIPNSVTEIGDYAFCLCRGLSSVTIPNSVTKIGDYAFYYCSGLKSVTIPNTVTEIGTEAFYRSSLSNVIIQSPKLWSQIKFESEYDNPIYESKKFSVNGMEVEHLDLDIDNSHVSDYAFYRAENLKTIRVKGEGIGSCSFYNCNNVTDLCLDVDSVGYRSFTCCDNMKAIYCMTTEPPVAPDDAFTKYEGVTLYVPVGSRSKYENAENCWWRFLDVIETDFAGIDAIFKADYVDNENPNGVEAVFGNNPDSDIDFSLPLEVYTLNGVRIANSIDCLAPGLYIVRQGNRSRKIAIK